MKINFVLFLSSIILATLACTVGQPSTYPGYYDPGAANKTQTAIVPAQLIEPSQIPQTKQIEPTQTPIPSATIDYQQTAIIADRNAQNAQGTAQAANIIVAQITADYASNEASKKIAEDQRLLAQAQAASDSINATASSYPTSFPATAAQQIININIESTRTTSTQTAPTLIVAMAKSQTFAKYSDRIQASQIGFQWAMNFFIGILALFLIWSVALNFSKLRSNAKEDNMNFDIPDPEDQPIIIPMAIDPKNPHYTTRAEVECSIDQLLEFADGIINRHMTAAFNPWEKTNVHKNLKQIRKFLEDHHFAKLIRGSGGELDILAEGEQFLRDSLERGEPPPPFKCIG